MCPQYRRSHHKKLQYLDNENSKEAEMESKSGSTHREYTTANSMADRQNSSPAVRMGVAESIKYRFLEKQWEEEQWAFIALVRNQKDRK